MAGLQNVAQNILENACTANDCGYHSMNLTLNKFSSFDDYQMGTTAAAHLK